MFTDSSVRRIVITGMSGTGKTAVLNELRTAGYTCFDEPARKILEARLAGEGEGFGAAFVKLMLQQSLADFSEAATTKIAFFDRGLPDVVAYAIRFDVAPDAYRAKAQEHRYEAKVFVTPPWPEIFKHDPYRRASYDDYLRFHDLLLKTYEELGYSPIDLPKQAVHERVAFIRRAVENGT